ncbi:MAG: NAD(P)-binding domain-containing protein [Spirochaetes bacterium]|nr:NAD(P)-binding domain-containing protein [Spirochaetota bacterium]
MRQIKSVAIIGAGSWGTAVARDIAESKPHMTVTLWAHERSVVSSINSRHENSEFLPGVKLPLNVRAVHELKNAVEGADVVILATPSKVAYEVSQKMARFITGDMHVGFLTKGFCRVQNEVLTISQAMERAIPSVRGRIVAISGPSHAEEVSQFFHTCLNAGSLSAESRGVIARILTSSSLSCRETDDIRAVEVGGTLKNPAAIAAGMISVLPRCGDNLAGALIAEALKEMVRLGKLFGISEEKMMDISGLGDLVATALSRHSRNRRFGRDIAGQIMRKGKTLDLWDRVVLRIRPESVIERMSGKLHYLAEGAYAIEPLIELAGKADISIPVYRALYEVLLNKKDPSLLIETIKNPDNFSEIYHSTKIRISEKKKGLESVTGKIFRETIISRTLDQFMAKQGNNVLPYDPAGVIGKLREMQGRGGLSSSGRGEEGVISRLNEGSYEESVRSLAGMYADRIMDNFNPAFKTIFLLILTIVGAISTFFGKKRRLLTSGKVGEINGIRRTVNVLYIATRGSVSDSLAAILAIFRKRLPFPRFFVSSDVTSARDLFLLKRCGGFIVDRSMIENPVYRETLRQYISILAGHGVPVLYFQGIRKDGEPEVDEFISAVTESMYRHTVEMALVPVEISYRRGETEFSGGYVSYVGMLADVIRVNFSRPIYLSEYTKQFQMIKDLPAVIAGTMGKDRKIFPHYIVCRVLAEKEFRATRDELAMLARDYMRRAGRDFEYSPQKTVKAGLRFLENSGIVGEENGVVTAVSPDRVAYFSRMLG